jgi:hypothetical protein
LIVTPSASCAHSNTAVPTASPALMIVRSLTSNRSFGRGNAFIIILSAVGNRNVLRIPYLSMSANARSGSKRPR